MPHDATEAFRDVFKRYPNQHGLYDAASAWQAILDAGFVGGEPALRSAILARFKAGQLQYPPYKGPLQFRPKFETYLMGYAWVESLSAPDDPAPEKPVETFEERRRREARERETTQKAEARAADARARAAIAAVEGGARSTG
jgi:hypothetical protein